MGSSAEYKSGLERAVAKGGSARVRDVRTAHSYRLHESDVHRRGAAKRIRAATGVDSQDNRAGEVYQPDSPSLLERIGGGIGQARRYSIGIRGIGADVWCPHTVRSARMSPGRGVPCRDIVASSHGLR
jgi:hypothetical protein